MRQLAAAWTSLDPRRKVAAALALGALALVVALVARMAGTAPLALLYAGLDPAAAGELVQALERRGVTYEVRGDALYVDARARDALRLTLAAEGLPASGGAGYELLDGLSGFGTTAQMFDAAYWRAKEGELARTIAASPHIRAARVHIAQPSAQPFARPLRPTASVTLTPAQGPVAAAQARAIRHLVAASVPGLAAADVAVIDAASGLVLAADGEEPAARGDDLAATLRRNAERLLEARVGPGRAVVEVAVDLVAESETVVERLLDPDRRALVSQESEERTASAADSRDAGVTVASNLPEGDAGSGGGSSRSQSAETRTRAAFEVSETRRELQRPAGGIRRLTVAVLIDERRSAEPAGTEAAGPRPPEEIEALRELVAAAVGYDPGRGDVITLRSLPFGAPGPAGTAADESLLDGLDPMRLAQLLALVAVALVLALFVLRPLLLAGARRGAPPAPAAVAGLPAPAAAGAPAVPAAVAAAADPGTRVLTGEIAEGAVPETMPVVGGTSRADPRAAAAAGAGEPDGRGDPVERLRRLIRERQAETVEILRGWMEEREERP